MDGINSDKSSLLVNDNNENEPKKTNNPVKEDRNALNSDRPDSKKTGKKQPIKKTGDRSPEEEKLLGDETEITDETTI